MIVDISSILYAQDVLDKFNKKDLSKVKFKLNGKEVEFEWWEIEEFKFAGLVNECFLLERFVFENVEKQLHYY